MGSTFLVFCGYPVLSDLQTCCTHLSPADLFVKPVSLVEPTQAELIVKVTGGCVHWSMLIYVIIAGKS